MKNNNNNLFIEEITKFLLGVILVGLLIFLPAGTISYVNGWIFMGILFIPMFFAGLVMIAKNPNLLRSRLNAKENQKVIDTGLYGVVRHPMYSATILLFLSMPIVLGSIYSFIIFLVYPIIIAMRIKSEEEFLEKELGDYKEYKNKVKYRMIPFIW